MLGFALALLVSFASPTLLGRVTDTSGNPIARAEITLTSSDGKVLRVASDERGAFRLEIPGPFQLEIRHAGFRSIRSSSIAFPRDGVYQIEVPLYSGDPEVFEQVDLELQELQDPESRNDPSVREGLPKSDRLFGLRGGVNVSGIREGSGQQWVATSGNVFTSSAMAASINETADFSAELGDSASVDDALPAGEDAFHGNVHYFVRDQHLNARNFFDPADSPIPPFTYNFFGGDAGGRIRDGTYFYSQYWGLRIHQSLTRAATVPNPAWLEGDFSNVADPVLDPETGFQFPGNRIPQNRFNPAGFALAKLYPKPNVGGATTQNYRGVARLRTSADAVGFRLDRRWSAADEGFAEYQFNRDTTDDPFNLLSGITNLPFYGVRDALQTHSLRLHNTHVISPDLIDEFRFSLAYLKQPRTILDSAPLPAILMTGPSHIGHAPNLPQERRNRSFEFFDQLSWDRPRHSTRAGGEVRYLPFHASMDLYSRGQYQFTGGIFSGNAFANLLLGLPTNALRIAGDTSRDFRTWMQSFYLQHDRRLTQTLSLNAGVRYDYQSPFSEAAGRVGNFNAQTGQMAISPRSLYRADRNNWGPRLGFAWQPREPWIVRGGFGIFYDTLAVGDSLFLLGLNPPFVQFDIQNNGPVLPLFTIQTAFDNALDTIHPSVFSTSRDLPNPYVQQWNVVVERPLPWRLTGEAAYYGQKGTRLRRQLNLNQPSPGSLMGLDDRRPFPDFRNIFQFETSASSIAHALDLRVNRSFREGMGFVADYRFSRLIDDATLISVLPQNSHDLRAERGLADFQIKHRLSFQVVANLPPVSYLKGWQVHGIGTLQSGTPLSAVLGADVAGTGSPIVNRPDLLYDPNTDHPTAAQFFDPAAFAVPAPGQFGNSGRNVIIGPGIANLDLALSRLFRVTDLSRLQFRADAYNVLNHTNFVAPPSVQNFADSDEFGALFVARSPRILQFGVKFLW